ADQHTRAFRGEGSRGGQPDTRRSGGHEHPEPVNLHIHRESRQCTCCLIILPHGGGGRGVVGHRKALWIITAVAVRARFASGRASSLVRAIKLFESGGV